MGRLYLALLLALGLAGCSGPVLKRCPDAVADDTIWQCDDQVQGIYRTCSKPAHLYHCQDAQ